MKLQLISDLHLDINRNYPFSLPDSETFTVIAGDISAYTDEAVKWIHENVKQGVFIEGNHIGYSGKKHSIQYYQTKLENEFPIDGSVSYLYDNYKVVNDVVFVGGIMFTDFRLYGEGTLFFAKQASLNGLNDYRYNYYNAEFLRPTDAQDVYGIIKKVSPSNYETMFYRTKKAIENACELFPDKKIVVVTHHAPSERSIDEIYKTSKSNASYASNLENFILDHPNIKLWCHGHIHTSSDYMIGDCRVVCNPRGYEKYEYNNGFESRKVIEI